MDEALVRNARNGDPRAFAELVEGYYRFIYGVAFSTVGDWQAAEDIAQDTFLVAWVNLGKLRSLEAFGVWLRRIARNLARNWVRSNRYRQDLRQRREALYPESGAAECEALENLTRADTRAQIWAALETLSPPLREVVVLYYLEENPIARTAAMLGVTENSVKKRLQHARPKLRSYFERQWMAELERERRRINRKDAGERFMAAVALGPVTGLAGRLGPGAGLWLHGKGAGRLASLLSVESAAVRTIAVALVVVAASAGGLLWNAHRQGPGAADPQPLPEVSEPAPHAASAGVAEAFPEAATAQKEAPESSAVEEPGASITSPATAEETAKSVTVAGHVFDEEQQPIGGATVTVVASGLDIPSIEPAGSFGGAGGMGSAGGFGGGVGGGMWGGGGGSFGGGGAVSAAGGGGFANTVGNPAFAPAGINETALLEALLDEARRFSVKSASDGSFSIADVPADGLLIISANAPGRCTHGTTISPASGAPATDLVLALSPGISIEGRALGARQQPVADGLVQITALAWNQDGSAGGWGKSPEAWGWTRTDAQGRFALTVEAAGQATVLARSPTHGKAAFQNVRVEPGAFADLRFPAQSAVQGRIIDHNGAPAAGKTVRLTGHAGTMAEDEAHGTQAWGETTSGTWEATTDAAGAYRIAGVDPQLRYTACVFDGDGTALAPDLELDALVAGQAFVWDYTLPRPIAVKGVVIEQTSGKPAAGAVVVCKAAGQAPEPPFILDMPAAQAVTGPDGAFELRITTGPGKYDFGTETVTGFRSLSQREMREGESAVLNLALPGTGSRNFLVLDEKGNPLQGVSVLLQPEGSDRAYGYPEQTGADGRIRVTGLPAGESVRCRFHCEGGEAESDAVANRGAVDSPEETIVIDTAK